MFSRPFLPAVLAGSCMLWVATAAEAAGARAGVHPAPGEMVLLRTVSARPAVRSTPPGLALIADPTPNRQLLPSLPGTELGDADFMALDTGQQLRHSAVPGNGVVAPMTRLMGDALGAGPAAGPGNRMQGTGAMGATAGGVLGNVGSATRGIGGQITSALSQLPFGQPATGGHP